MSNFPYGNSRPRITPEERHRKGLCRFLQAENLPLFVSVFTIGLFDVNGVKHVLMVLNAEEAPRPDGSKKPSGWGLPGGGICEGEAIEKAAIREFRDETGIDILDPKWERYEHDLLLPQPGGRRPEYAKCHNERVRNLVIGDGMKQCLIHVFTAEILGGPVVEEFGKLLEEGHPLIVDLTPEKGEALGIKEAKTGEIKAIGLFPLDELLDFERPSPEFYKSHLHRLRLALEPYMREAVAV